MQSHLAATTFAGDDEGERVAGLIRLAHEAHLAGQMSVALERCRSILLDFPDYTYGYSATAMLLLARGKPDEAEALIGRALTRFPAMTELLLVATEVAIGRQDWLTARKRLGVAVDGADEPGTLHQVRVLRAKIEIGSPPSPFRGGQSEVVDTRDVSDTPPLKEMFSDSRGSETIASSALSSGISARNPQVCCDSRRSHPRN